MVGMGIRIRMGIRTRTRTRTRTMMGIIMGTTTEANPQKKTN